MSSPTRRDEAWHAILTTCAETGVQDTFKKDDVADVADELGLGVSERTIIKALGVMVDFGYLQREEEQRAYRLDPSVVVGFGRWADEIGVGKAERGIEAAAEEKENEEADQ